jgi:hypothetical protein
MLFVCFILRHLSFFLFMLGFFDGKNPYRADWYSEDDGFESRKGHGLPWRSS